MLGTPQRPEEVGWLCAHLLFPHGYPQQPWYGEGGPRVEIVTHPHPYWDQLQRELCLPVFGLSMGLGAELGGRIPGWGFQAGLSVEKG